jgi:hypothetical protein
MLDERGIPIWLLILVLIVIPCAIAVFFGRFAWKHWPPNVFHCARCNRDFSKKPWLRFPSTCPHCAASDWNR